MGGIRLFPDPRLMSSAKYSSGYLNSFHKDPEHLEAAWQQGLAAPHCAGSLQAEAWAPLGRVGPEPLTPGGLSLFLAPLLPRPPRTWERCCSEKSEKVVLRLPLKKMQQ